MASTLLCVGCRGDEGRGAVAPGFQRGADVLPLCLFRPHEAIVGGDVVGDALRSAVAGGFELRA